MHSSTSKFALLSALSAGAMFSLATFSASAQTPWDVHRQQYQLSTGGTAASGTTTSGTATPTSGQGQTNRLQNQNTTQIQNTPQNQGILQNQNTMQNQNTSRNQGILQNQNSVQSTITTGQGGVVQTEMSTRTQAPAQTATTGTGSNLFQFTNQNTGSLSTPQGTEGITRYLQQGVSVETATVPQLASAIAQYNATNPDTVIGAVASLAAAYPEQAVKIAEAARSAIPDRALEVAMAIATVVPAAAIQIVVALAAADPSLAPTLAGLILPAAGGINQTSSSRGTGTIISELTVPGRSNNSASPVRP